MGQIFMPESKLARMGQIAPKDSAVTAKATKKTQKDKPGVLPDDSMEEAGRKVLAFHFETLLTYDPVVRRGLSPESDQPSHDLAEPVHNMRVTTRRLRSALRLFAPFMPRKGIKRFRRDLAVIGTALGEVRDLDVLHLKAGKYVETVPEANRLELAALLDDWQNRLGNARHSLLMELDSSTYTRFTMNFGQFVSTPIAGTRASSPDPIHVRHVVPRLVYQQYGIVRAYETVLDHAPLDTLHGLRIQAKRLRYMLESFEEVLDSDVKTVIEAVKGLQDHLGDLQDARVANQIMREYTQRVDERQPTSAVLQYMAVREAEMQRLLAEMQQAWVTFTRPEIRRSLALSVSRL